MGRAAPSGPGRPWYFARMHTAWDGARFQAALQRLMQDAGLERQDIAELAGIDRSQVSRWISGANRPRFDALQQLARAVRSGYPGSAGMVSEMLLAAGYPDGAAAAVPVTPASEDGDNPWPSFTPEERRLALAFIETLRHAAAERDRGNERSA